MLNQLHAANSEIRTIKPVILCLTNLVTMDFMANCLLAIGAAPIMTCDDGELEELIKISHCLNINIGTLDEAFISRCKKAIKFAKQYQKPIVLDPVGAGASLSRTTSAQALMPFVDIIRGNASEIMALVDSSTITAGVESTQSTDNAKKSADALASKLGNTVIVSGKEDYITDGQQKKSLFYGSELMPLVTGMGCALTAIVATFRAVYPDNYLAGELATAYYGLCGQVAEKNAHAPGSFRTAFIDALYNIELTEVSL